MDKSESRPSEPRIRVTRNGPYLVSAGTPLSTRVPMRNEAGEPVAWEAGEDRLQAHSYALCRCGRSGTKPFCDGSHERWAFDGSCTADRAPGAARRKVFEGVGVSMTDDPSLCAGYEYCDRHGGVWRTIAATADPAVRDELLNQVALCPSGRLEATVAGHSSTEEPSYGRAIATIPDGPLWAMGSIPVLAEDGHAYEVRNRQLLCRCGQSANKPFCDGTHYKVGFKSG